MIFLKEGLSGTFLVAFSSLFSLLLSITMSRNLDVDEFSEVQFFFSISLFLSSMCKVGLDTIYLKDWHKLDINNKVNFVSMTVAISLIFCACFTFFFGYLYDYNMFLVLVLFFTTLFMVLTVFISSYYKVKGLAGRGLKIDSFYNRAIFLLILLLLVFFVGEVSLSDVLVLNLISFSIPIFLYTPYKKIFINIKLFNAFILLFNLKKYYRMAIALSIAGLAQSYLRFIDLFYIEKYLNGLDLAVYSIAVRFSIMLFMLNTVVIAILAPKITKSYNDGDFSNVNKYYTISVAMLCSMSAFALFTFYILGEWVISLFGVNYFLAYEITLILLIFNFLNLSLGLSGIILSLVGGHKDFMLIMLGVSLVGTLFYPYITVEFGLFGVAYFTGLLMVSWKLLSFFLLSFKYNVRVVRIW